MTCRPYVVGNSDNKQECVAFYIQTDKRIKVYAGYLELRISGI